MTRVYVSIGSNEDRERNIRLALSELQRRFGPLRRSSLFESSAVGFDGDPFYNLVAGFDTGLAPRAVIDCLKGIEDQSGRDRSRPKFSARSLDIDLLLHGDRVDSRLDLPRHEILRHAHVLKPLAELAPCRRHPVDGRTFRELWEVFEYDRASIWTADFQPQEPGTR